MSQLVHPQVKYWGRIPSLPGIDACTHFIISE